MLEFDGVGFSHDRGDAGSKSKSKSRSGSGPGSWLFRGVSHRVAPGEILTVLGPNGRGKTTLLRCLAGLASPTEGRVRAGGAVAFVPQSHHTTFAYTVLDMVLMGRVRHLRPLATPGRRDHEVAGSALERVGLAHLAGRDYPTLSGGERQLVLIARAIAAQGPVLVLDEPASALDLRNQGRVLHLLRGLADEGHAIVLTTHHPDHAMEIADTAMLMFGGTDVRVGPAGDLLTDSNVGDLYGVRAHTLTLDGARPEGPPRRVIVTRYDDDQELSP